MGSDLTARLASDRIAAAHEPAGEMLGGRSPHWSFTVRIGDPAVESARPAEDYNADSLVVGRSGSRLRRRPVPRPVGCCGGRGDRSPWCPELYPRNPL